MGGEDPVARGTGFTRGPPPLLLLQRALHPLPLSTFRRSAASSSPSSSGSSVSSRLGSSAPVNSEVLVRMETPIELLEPLPSANTERSVGAPPPPSRTRSRSRSPPVVDSPPVHNRPVKVLLEMLREARAQGQMARLRVQGAAPYE